MKCIFYSSPSSSLHHCDLSSLLASLSNRRVYTGTLNIVNTEQQKLLIEQSERTLGVSKLVSDNIQAPVNECNRQMRCDYYSGLQFAVMSERRTVGVLITAPWGPSVFLSN